MRKVEEKQGKKTLAPSYWDLCLSISTRTESCCMCSFYTSGTAEPFSEISDDAKWLQEAYRLSYVQQIVSLEITCVSAR